MKPDYLKVDDKITERLRVMDYVFCYKDVDLNNAILDYHFGKIENVKFENGKKIEESERPTIEFQINADDESKETYGFSFVLDMDLNLLNKMPNRPININEYVIQGEIFFQNPYSDHIEFMDFQVESIYEFTQAFGFKSWKIISLLLKYNINLYLFGFI